MGSGVTKPLEEAWASIMVDAKDVAADPARKEEIVHALDEFREKLAPPIRVLGDDVELREPDHRGVDLFLDPGILPDYVHHVQLHAPRIGVGAKIACAPTRHRQQSHMLIV